MTMKKGEIAVLTNAPEYAFGDSNSQQELAVVPPNYEVELVSFVKVSSSFISIIIYLFNAFAFGYKFIWRLNLSIL